MSEQNTWAIEWRDLRLHVDVDECSRMTAVRIESVDPGAPVEPGLVSRMPLARLVREEAKRRADKARATRGARGGSAMFAQVGTPADQYLTAFTVDMRGRGRRRTDEDWARLAVGYEWERALGFDPQEVNRRWGERFGGSRVTWNNRTHKARELGYLTTDGMATPAALALVGLAHSPTDELSAWAEIDSHTDEQVHAVDELDRYRSGQLDELDVVSVDREQRAVKRAVKQGRMPPVPRDKIEAAFRKKKVAKIRQDLGHPTS